MKFFEKYGYAITEPKDYFGYTDFQLRKKTIPQPIATFIPQPQPVADFVPAPAPFIKRENQSYIKLANANKQLYNDIYYYIRARKEQLCENELVQKLRKYNRPFRIMNDINGIYVDMENFRIPETGYFTIK